MTHFSVRLFIQPTRLMTKSSKSLCVSAIVDALSDPKKFLTIAEKRADQMKALGIDTVHMGFEAAPIRIQNWSDRMYLTERMQPV